MIFNIQKLAIIAAVAFSSVSALSIPGHGVATIQAREPSTAVAAREEVRSFEPSRVIQGPAWTAPSAFWIFLIDVLSARLRSNKRCIKITKKFGGVDYTIGYLSEDDIHGNGIFKVTSEKRDCLKVVAPTGSGPFDLPIHGENGSKKYLGLAGNDGLKASYPVRTRQTSVNARPQGVGNTSGLSLSESAVWSVSGNTLTAIWWPENGNKINVKTMFWPQERDYLYFVTKPAGFSQIAPSAYEVTLHLVSP
ncbi:hypothetical protein EST38_g6806 [Candolleomyces aberdarensis]|uniref:Uncharacterized protein n=1 Tax=Candolleomyces aberdarensis TaxID=2316362 RepID=A0A4Q2DGX3_9AGAR|nr:hypothetical protein EST38_g6806 [Candolleomyces aberdarensis]